MSETTPPTTEPEKYDPRDAVFPLELLSNDEVREMSRVLMHGFMYAETTGGHAEDVRTSLNDKLGASLRAFCRAQPDRAVELLLAIANDPHADSGDLYTAEELGTDLFEADPQRAFEGLLAAAYNDQHYQANGDYPDGGVQAQLALFYLQEGGRLSDDQVQRLNEREQAWN